MDKIGFTGLMTALCVWCFGGINLHLIETLFFLISIDYILTIFVNVKENVSIRKSMWKNFGKKYGEMVIIIIGCQLDKTGLFSNICNFETISVYAYIVYEVSCILDNFVILGVYVPKPLQEKISNINRKD
jgi:phage-related holin